MNLQQDCLLAPNLFSSITTSENSMKAAVIAMLTIHNQPVVNSQNCTYLSKHIYSSKNIHFLTIN
jgi:hypothetical protein